MTLAVQSIILFGLGFVSASAIWIGVIFYNAGKVEDYYVKKEDYDELLDDYNALYPDTPEPLPENNPDFFREESNPDFFREESNPDINTESKPELNYK